jgi:hypothetical protein
MLLTSHNRRGTVTVIDLQNSVGGAGGREHDIVRLAPEPDVPDILGVESGRSKFSCQGSGEIFINKEVGHLRNGPHLLRSHGILPG